MISKRWSARPNKWILKIIKLIFLTAFGGNLFVLFLPYHHQIKKSPAFLPRGFVLLYKDVYNYGVYPI